MVPVLFTKETFEGLVPKIPKIESGFVETAFTKPFGEVTNFFESTGGLITNGVGDIWRWLTKYVYWIICLTFVVIGLVVFIKCCTFAQICWRFVPKKKKRYQPCNNENIYSFRSQK